MKPIISILIAITIFVSAYTYFRLSNDNNETFKNLEPFDHSWGDVLKWKLESGPDSWKEIQTEFQPAPEKQVMGSALSWNVINHSTVLIQTEGLNIITDPVFSESVPNIPIIGVSRVRAPGIAFKDLPKIDLVLISHDHYDHMDKLTIMNLYHQNKPMFVVGKNNGEVLIAFGVPQGNIIELEWWQSYQHNQLNVHFVPAQHHSGRTLFDLKTRLWGGFYLESSWGSSYFSGDTGYGKHFKLIREKYGAPDLSFLPIGAYKPTWFMSPQHISPEGAVRAHIALGSKKSVAVHFGTFQLADNSYDDPKSDLEKALERHQIKTGFVLPTFGETVKQPRTSSAFLNLFDQLKEKVVEELHQSINDLEIELNKP